MRKAILVLVAMISLSVFVNFAQPSYAVTILGSGLYGSFTGDFTYNASLARLSVALTNTSSYGNGGYLTAFVFNNPGNQITGVSWAAISGNPSDADFGILFNNNNINGAPYGKFDIGASISGAFEGGGNPHPGIAYGDTETFIFQFTGSGLGSLNENSFLSELSTGTGAGEGYKSFVARFRGFEPDASDKVPGYPGDNGGKNPVPEPASLSLLGLGLLSLPIIRLRKKSR
jgi:hypothetical protein